MRWSLEEIERLGDGAPPEAPGADEPAVVAFTSGATGPAKGVLYLHGQLQAQREQLASLYSITAADRLVAAFGPFALFGAALGIPSAVPDMNLTAPRTLTAKAMGDAAAAIDATMVFASPAALANVVATADGVDPAGRAALSRVRLLLSTGAPVPAETLHAMQRLLPVAEAHAPYGMTEVLPVADIDLAGLDEAGLGNGVCVDGPCPACRSAGTAGQGRRPERRADHSPGGDRRGVRPGGPHQGALRPPLGDRSGRYARPGLAPHRRRRALRRRWAPVDRGPAGRT